MDPIRKLFGNWREKKAELETQLTEEQEKVDKVYHDKQKTDEERENTDSVINKPVIKKGEETEIDPGFTTRMRRGVLEVAYKKSESKDNEVEKSVEKVEGKLPSKRSRFNPQVKDDLQFSKVGLPTNGRGVPGFTSLADVPIVTSLEELESLSIPEEIEKLSAKEALKLRNTPNEELARLTKERLAAESFIFDVHEQENPTADELYRAAFEVLEWGGMPTSSFHGWFLDASKEKGWHCALLINKALNHVDISRDKKIEIVTKYQLTGLSLSHLESLDSIPDGSKIREQVSQKVEAFNNQYRKELGRQIQNTESKQELLSLIRSWIPTKMKQPLPSDPLMYQMQLFVHMAQQPEDIYSLEDTKVVARSLLLHVSEFKQQTKQEILSAIETDKEFWKPKPPMKHVELGEWVECYHGSTRELLEDFLRGDGRGKSLEHTDAQGLQVHPNPDKDRIDRCIGYANRAARPIMDDPMVIRFLVPRALLDKMPNSYEAGFNHKYAPYMKVVGVMVGKNQIMKPDLESESISIPEQKKAGKQAFEAILATEGGKEVLDKLTEGDYPIS